MRVILHVRGQDWELSSWLERSTASTQHVSAHEAVFMLRWALADSMHIARARHALATQRDAIGKVHRMTDDAIIQYLADGLLGGRFHFGPVVPVRRERPVGSAPAPEPPAPPRPAPRPAAPPPVRPPVRAAREPPPPEEAEEPEPTITVRWGRAWVEPVHNKNFRPTSPPTDDIPDESKVDMVVDTTDVPDGTPASIQVYQCELGFSVPGGTFAGLVVQGGQVVDPATGARPFMMFTADDLIYAPWDKDLYYFQATVDFQGLSATTEQDAVANEPGVLRVRWYHMSVADSIADTPAGGGLTTQAEMREIKRLIEAKPHHKAGTHAFNAPRLGVNFWGSWLRNTYCYHHASHGDIVDRTTGAQLNAGAQNPPRNAVRNWRSVIIIGNTALGDAEVNTVASVPSTPRYLAYLDTCVAGWEPSFAHAITGRGTQNVIAFRMYIPDGDARSMARRFYRAWIGTHNGDPSKINTVFFDVGSRYYWTMRPVLFGTAGGEIVRGGRGPNQLMGQISQDLGLEW